MKASKEELEKAKTALGKSVSIVQGDVSNLADLDRLYSTVKTEKGVVDVVVVSAAFVGHAAQLLECEPMAKTARAELTHSLTRR